MDSRELDVALAVADANPTDVEAQIAAAYGCDRQGMEDDAIRYYDAAWQLGVPTEERCRFMVGYGSTLRNVGRVEESIAVHLAGVSEFPEFSAHRAFLALALGHAGKHDQALGQAITALLDTGAERLGGYDRALALYRDQLLASN